MSISLADLITRLKEDVPQVDSVPTDDQYDRAVKRGVEAFSEDLAMQSVVTLTIVKDTAAYNLPTDFVEVIKFEDPSQHTGYAGSGVLLTTDGIVPIGTGFSEDWYIVPGDTPQITFHPTPTYAATRYLWYRAKHILDGSDIYQTLTETHSELATLLAQAILLEEMAVQTAQDGWSYQQGDVRVSTEGLAEGYRDQAKSVRDDYKEQIKALKRSAGRRGRLDVSGR